MVSRHEESSEFIQHIKVQSSFPFKEKAVGSIPTIATNKIQYDMSKQALNCIAMLVYNSCKELQITNMKKIKLKVSETSKMLADELRRELAKIKDKAKKKKSKKK